MSSDTIVAVGFLTGAGVFVGSSFLPGRGSAVLLICAVLYILTAFLFLLPGRLL